MGRTQLLAGACVAVCLCCHVGCASKPPAGRKQPGPAARVSDRNAAKPQAPDGGVADATPSPGDVADVAPQSMAQHAEVYAQNLEAMLAKRAAAKPQAAVPAPAPPSTESTDRQPAPSAANTAMAVAPARPAIPNAPVRTIAETAAAPAPATPVKPSPVPQAAARQAPASQPQPRPQAQVSPAAPAPAPTATPGAATHASAALPKDDVLAKLAARARDYPRDAAAQLDYQLLQFLRDESVPDLGPLAPLASEDRELLTALLDGLSNFRNGLRAESNMLQSRKVSPLLEMGDRIRGQGELTLPTAALCTKVERFGVYEPMEPATFKAGAANEAILYCEVANFSAQLGDKRTWETKLKHESVLYSETGLAVWSDKADVVTDHSRNRRQDFYVVEKLTVPPMPVGRYLLKVTVTDLQVNRVAEATVPIQVVAQ